MQPLYDLINTSDMYSLNVNEFTNLTLYEIQLVIETYVFFMVFLCSFSALPFLVSRFIVFYFIHLKSKRIKLSDNIDVMDPCVICLEPFKFNQSYRKLSCKHTFHTACIEKWITASQSSHCPICKHIEFHLL